MQSDAVLCVLEWRQSNVALDRPSAFQNDNFPRTFAMSEWALVMEHYWLLVTQWGIPLFPRNPGSRSRHLRGPFLSWLWLKLWLQRKRRCLHLLPCYKGKPTDQLFFLPHRWWPSIDVFSWTERGWNIYRQHQAIVPAQRRPRTGDDRTYFKVGGCHGKKDQVDNH